jgi:hypothetical protein
VFAPKVAKHSKAAANSIDKLAPQHSMLAARPLGGDVVEQAHMLQQSIGNQATLRLLRQGARNLIGNVPHNHDKQAADPASLTAQVAKPSLSWDFSKIPLYPPDRASRPQSSPPLDTASLPGAIQAKLIVGQVNDPLEHEADRVADQVMRMPAPEIEPAAALPQISRKCAACETEEEEQLQKKEARTSEATFVLRSPGQPLDATTRAYFEPRFGQDFSNVRVHTGGTAEQSARGLNAQAYTVGHNIVFGAGRFAPGTHEGQQLLAHELTHVVQQTAAYRRNVGPGRDKLGLSPIPTPHVQRKLLVTGKPVDVRALLDLLEAGTGDTFNHDPRTKEVSITSRRATPPSAVLAGRLEEIIDDPANDAELNLGRKPGVSFGAFPASDGPLIQEIVIEDFSSLEAKAPGSGVALLSHEIAENYFAHTQRAVAESHEELFAVSHEEALEVEARVAGELVAPGKRVARATRVFEIKGKQVVRSIDDYENYFLVQDFATGILINAWQAPRVNVATFTIDGFAPGSEAVPPAAQSTIAAAANAMQRNPAATVRIDVGGQDHDLAKKRAFHIQNAILDVGRGSNLAGFDMRSEYNFNLVATGVSKEQALITVDQPDTEVAGYRGSLVKQVLAGRAPRR